MIVTVDEDPIFGQVVFTLFRAVTQNKLNRTYQGVAESLYQELTQADREITLDKTSGWRLHIQYQYLNGEIHLKDIIEGQNMMM